MTDQELQQLATEHATTDGVTNEIVADICETFLRWLTKTHCIVKKSGVKEEYEGWRQFLGTKDEDKAMAAMWQLEEVFGTELFEERSEK